ncbi:peptidyl-prolyl cis-trans isomerase FKBP8-like [Penaeus japonicus]|uniref:peptidyl-prolyl cis-trans isomerase FKBP8-like n=1 Tax=Penaeus japonicus TaxID=27405 RepID=UPI001C710E63|nr:peptidyl-prolyl cis-trans isomerase FKBP8-like [Penaeus japonicus]
MGITGTRYSKVGTRKLPVDCIMGSKAVIRHNSHKKATHICKDRKKRRKIYTHIEAKASSATCPPDKVQLIYVNTSSSWSILERACLLLERKRLGAMPEVDQSKEVKVEKVQEVEMEGKVEEEVSDEWLDVLGSGDLKKKVIKPGIIDHRPVKGDTVVVRAVGRLEDGKEVDVHDELTFTVGDSEVIVGLDMIVPLMDKGETAEVYVASRFAYGSKGLPPSIPPDVPLVYTLEILDSSPDEEPDSLPIPKRMTIGNRKRERGNWWFNREEYTTAIHCYSAAVDYLDDATEEYGEEVRDEVKPLLVERLKALNNMGAAQIKVGAYEVALKSLEAVLRCQPYNVKALFRKGKVLGLQGKFKDAIMILKSALELEPESRLIHQELAKIREKAREQSETEKSMYRKMLGLKKEYTQEDQRYPVIKSFPWRAWFVIFVTLLVLLIAYKYRDPLMRTFI